jgi:signal recognition particle subunit SRP19
MVIWAAGIDRNKSRRGGRRISKSIAVDSPKLGELEAAARTLSLSFTSRQAASRPRLSREKSGYLIVEKRGSSRTEMLKTVAKQVAKERASRKIQPA